MATRSQILAVNLAYAVNQFYLLWGATHTLVGYSVYFTYNGNWLIAPTGTESKFGYYSAVPLTSAYATLTAFQTAVTAAAVDKGFNIFS